MREIKFRAWDDRPDAQKMYNADNSPFLMNFNGDLSIYGTWARIGHSLKLMQYTGLKDKNGVDIYEGDILEYQESDYSFHAAVEWGDNGYVMSGHWLNGGNDNFSFDDNEPEELEVIGNIYENPELLGK